MQSILRRQWMLRREAFERDHGHPWLVWEPGPSRPAPATGSRSQARTLEPLELGAPRPADGDPVCFELAFPAGQRALEVGRAADNDLVISDVALADFEFSLVQVHGTWLVAPPESAVTVNGRALATAAPLRLLAGDVVQVADVHLTYYDAPGMVMRLLLALRPAPE